MDYKFMDALNVVKEDMIKDGMEKESADNLIEKLIWTIICRL